MTGVRHRAESVRENMCSDLIASARYLSRGCRITSGKDKNRKTRVNGYFRLVNERGGLYPDRFLLAEKI